MPAHIPTFFEEKTLTRPVAQLDPQFGETFQGHPEKTETHDTTLQHHLDGGLIRPAWNSDRVCKLLISFVWFYHQTTTWTIRDYHVTLWMVIPRVSVRPIGSRDPLGAPHGYHIFLNGPPSTRGYAPPRTTIIQRERIWEQTTRARVARHFLPSKNQDSLSIIINHQHRYHIRNIPDSIHSRILIPGSL